MKKSLMSIFKRRDNDSLKDGLQTNTVFDDMFLLSKFLVNKNTNVPHGWWPRMTSRTMKLPKNDFTVWLVCLTCEVYFADHVRCFDSVVIAKKHVREVRVAARNFRVTP